MSNKMPYTMRAALAAVAGPEYAHKVIQEAMFEIGQDVSDIVNKYGVRDLPIVLAVMQSTINASRGILGESGEDIMNYILKATACCVIPVDTIKKMKEEETDE